MPGFIVLARKMCVVVLNYFISLLKANLTMLDSTYQMIFTDYCIIEMAEMKMRCTFI